VRITEISQFDKAEPVGAYIEIIDANARTLAGVYASMWPFIDEVENDASAGE